MHFDQIFQLPVEELKRSARMGVRLFPDIPSMIEYFADFMVEELRQNNANGAVPRMLPLWLLAWLRDGAGGRIGHSAAIRRATAKVP